MVACEFRVVASRTMTLVDNHNECTVCVESMLVARSDDFSLITGFGFVSRF